MCTCLCNRQNTSQCHERAASVSADSRSSRAGTTFTKFRFAHGPGILALPGSRLWLDGCTFRDITLTPFMRTFQIESSSVSADENVQLVLVVCPQP